MAPFPEPADEARESIEAMRDLGPELAREAAAIRKTAPQAPLVGIIAAPGTVEAKRCRTRLEQRTGVEFVPGAFAGVMSVDDLNAVLDPAIPPAVRDWLAAGVLGPQIRFIVCTRNGFQLGGSNIPDGAT